MPPKPRNSKGKPARQSKKSKAIQRQGTTAANPETSTRFAQIVESAKLTEVRQTTKVQTVEYPYVTGDLKRIGIIAAIIIVILVVLAIVIP
jgi:hypothetical protein